jgi:hypothetical protein
MLNGGSGSWRPGGGASRAVMAVVLMATLSPLSLPPIVSAGPGYQPPSPAVYINEQEKTANVSDSDCIVGFTGNVSIEGMLLWNCTVNLTAHLEVGWPCVVTPAFLFFTNRSNQSFIVSVTVPRSASSTSNGTLLVRGNLTTKGSIGIGETKALINVEPFLRLNFSANVSSEESKPGEESIFHLDVQDSGNQEAPVVIVVPDINGLQDRGWSIRLGPGEANISEGGWQRFTIRVRAPGGLVLSDKRTVLNITVATRGKQDPEPIPYGSVHLAVTVKADWSPVVGPLTILIVIAVLIAVAAVRRARRRRK